MSAIPRGGAAIMGIRRIVIVAVGLLGARVELERKQLRKIVGG